MGNSKTYLKESKPFGDRWDESCIDVFHQIIQCLTECVPDVLHTDASLKELGAVLYQEHPEGLWRSQHKGSSYIILSFWL